MKRKLQFAGWLVALGMSAVLAAPSFAQEPRANRAQNRQDNKPPRQQQQESRRAQNERQNSGGNRPPNPNVNRADMMGQPNINPNRPPSAYNPPPKKEFNSLSPQERQKVLENNRQLNDPNFTKGMSEEDKATLHDLSHLHVGGTPEPPNE